MAFSSDIKDSSAITDSELKEMAELASESRSRFELGFLEKAREEWNLVTRCFENSKPVGFCYSTLERIGGTPAILIGLGFISAKAKGASVLKRLMKLNYKKALIAFPDEDVLVTCALDDPKGYILFKELTDVVPRPNYVASGEERAWGRRIAKRFGLSSRYDDRSFCVKGSGEPPQVFEILSAKIVPDQEISSMFSKLNKKAHDVYIVFGWALSEKLATDKYAS